MPPCNSKPAEFPLALAALLLFLLLLLAGPLVHSFRLTQRAQQRMTARAAAAMRPKQAPAQHHVAVPTRLAPWTSAASSGYLLP